MSTAVSVTIDSTLIKSIENNDIDSFKHYLSNDKYLIFEMPVKFKSVQETLDFVRFWTVKIHVAIYNNSFLTALKNPTNHILG